MAQNSNTQPTKSILKKHERGSIESADVPSTSKHPDHLKFDESNIKATFHPPDKDYGFIKIEEPKTPYSDYQEPEDGTEGFERQSSFVRSGPQALDADLVSQKLLGVSPGASGANPPQDNEFQNKRKAHYQEFKATKELMKKEEDDDDETEDKCKPNHSKK